jgi:hypothetical protein
MTAKPKRRFFWLYMLALLMICAALYSVVTFTQLSVPTPDPSVNEFQQTATYIIAAATASVETMNNPILRLWGSIRSVFNPSPSTATPHRAYIAPTPIPTFTSAELQQLPARWVTSLETALGFSHPILEETINAFIQQSPPEILPDAYFYPPEIRRVNYGDDTYVAIVPMPALYFGNDAMSQFLLFRITDDVPTLIYEYGYDESTQYEYDASSMSMDINGFGDVNDNGYPDLASFVSGLHSCPNRILLLIEIQPNGEVLDITPQRTGEMSFVQARYPDGSDVLALHFIEGFYVPYALEGCLYPRISRYFGWDGTAYQEISATVDESNYSVISTFWDNISEDAVCIIPDRLMYEMLLSEYVRGNFLAAWERLEPRLRWDECSAETLAGWEITSFEEWVTTLYLTAPTPSP